jgi:hypothetical protein
LAEAGETKTGQTGIRYQNMRETKHLIDAPRRWPPPFEAGFGSYAQIYRGFASRQDGVRAAMRCEGRPTATGDEASAPSWCPNRQDSLQSGRAVSLT